MPILPKKQKLLNFDGDGLCLAMHLKANRLSFDVLDQVDWLNSDYNCITNIIKDSRVSIGAVRQQYPEFDEFVSRLNEYDPARCFQNTISQKLFPDANG